MADHPQVSVITPILNGAQTVETCIQCVLNQGYPLVEHVFVDGGSTDGTVDIIMNYARIYPENVKYISAPGTGPGEAANLGYKAAQGDIFVILGVDDFCETGALETVVDFFRCNPDAYFVHGHCDFIDESGEIIRQSRANGFNFRDFVNTTSQIATPSSYYRRAVMEKIGWLDSSGDDFDMLIRIAQQFEVFQVDKVLSKSTLRQDSAFNPSDPKKRVKIYRDTFKVSRRYGGSIFSKIARRYYRRVVFNWLHLDPLEPQYLAIRRWMERLGGGSGP